MFSLNYLFIFTEPDERDVIILHHDIGVCWPVGRRERKTITLVEYGQPQGNTAMARTVGLPAAIATKMILKGIKFRSFLDLKLGF